MEIIYRSIWFIVVTLVLADPGLGQRTFSPAEMKEDLRVMKMALMEVHPGLYRYNTPAKLERKFDTFEGKINNPLADSEFFKLFAQMLSEIKCYHTYPNPLNQREEVKKELFDRTNLLPFYFEIIDRKMIVTANASPETLSMGSRITKINGISFDAILKDLLTVTFADGIGTLEHRLKTLEVDRSSESGAAIFDSMFPLFVPPKDGKYEIEAIDAKDKKRKVFKTQAMTKAARTAAMTKVLGGSPGYDDGWKFEIWSDGTAYLRASHFITWKLSFNYKEFLSKVFTEMNSKGTKNLIIDIRGNGGGDSEAPIEILRGIAKEAFPCTSSFRTYIRTAKADPALFKYSETYDKELLAALTNGVPQELYRNSDNGLLEFLGDAKECKPHQPLPDAFKGNAYLLVDSANASAAFSMAKIAKQNKLATLVGQVTGGNERGFNGGSYLFTYLPNSKFEFDIPVFGYISKTPQMDTGITPDILVGRNPEDVGNKFDRVMTTVKKIISKEKL